MSLAGTEYAQCLTRTVLQSLTTTDSSTYSGSFSTLSSRMAASSSAIRARPLLARRFTSSTKPCQASTLSKSRWPRSNSACSSDRFSAPLVASMSPFCSLAPTSVVRGFIPKCFISATYSTLNVRFCVVDGEPLPAGIRCVAAVELSVWCHSGMRPS